MALAWMCCCCHGCAYRVVAAPAAPGSLWRWPSGAAADAVHCAVSRTFLTTSESEALKRSPAAASQLAATRQTGEEPDGWSGGALCGQHGAAKPPTCAKPQLWRELWTLLNLLPHPCRQEEEVQVSVHGCAVPCSACARVARVALTFLFKAWELLIVWRL